MNCPVCKSPMIILELNEIEIDYCSSCSGVWLDSGELELLIDNESEKEKLISSFNIDKDYPEKSYKCPICRKKMQKVHVGKNNEVLIDKCPANDGLWFDGGELKDVIKLASGDNEVVRIIREMFGSKINNNQNGEN
jgi:hypothetical protein